MPDFVLTPGGYRPAANVHEIPEGHTLRVDGDTLNIIRPDGTVHWAAPMPEPQPPETPLLPVNLSELTEEQILARGDRILLPEGVNLEGTGPEGPGEGPGGGLHPGVQ